MEFNGLLLLAALWFLLNLITKAGRKQQMPRDPRLPDRLRPRSLPTSPDATQQEGSRLELVLRELQRSLEEAAGQAPMERSRPTAEEMEERVSLEAEPEIRSLEEEVRRESRRRIDQDEQAEEIELGRIRAAQERDRERTKADHIAFHQRLRQEPAEHTAARTYTAQQLRDAIVWREILGPPLGLQSGVTGEK